MSAYSIAGEKLLVLGHEKMCPDIGRISIKDDILALPYWQRDDQLYDNANVFLFKINR